VVSAAPSDGSAGLTVADVGDDTACELAEQSPTLVSLGVTGASADASLVVELSMCTLTFDSPEQAGSSFGLSVLTSEDIALTAAADPATFAGTIVLLPELGENGHFIARAVDVDPASDPGQGAILAARGEIGVSLVWAATGAAPPFATMEQAVREILDATAG
jgi:hypothetical protein